LLSVGFAVRPPSLLTRDAGVPKSNIDDRPRMYRTMLRVITTRASTPITTPPTSPGLRLFDSPVLLMSEGGRPGASVIGGEVGNNPSIKKIKLTRQCYQNDVSLTN